MNLTKRDGEIAPSIAIRHPFTIGHPFKMKFFYYLSHLYLECGNVRASGRGVWLQIRIIGGLMWTWDKQMKPVDPIQGCAARLESGWHAPHKRVEYPIAKQIIFWCDDIKNLNRLYKTLKFYIIISLYMNFIIICL